MSLVLTICAVLGGIVSLAVILRMAWKGTMAVVRIADAMPTLLQVAEQFKPNGGSSLVDAVHRLELGQRALLMDKGYATLDDFMDHLETEYHSHGAPTGHEATERLASGAGYD